MGEFKRFLISKAVGHRAWGMWRRQQGLKCAICTAVPVAVFALLPAGSTPVQVHAREPASMFPGQHSGPGQG